MQRQRAGAGAPRQRIAGQKWVCLPALLALAICSQQCLPTVLAAAIDTGPIGAGFQTPLPPLSTFVQPGVYLGADNVLLGNTTFR